MQNIHVASNLGKFREYLKQKDLDLEDFSQTNFFILIDKITIKNYNLSNAVLNWVRKHSFCYNLLTKNNLRFKNL